MLDIRLIRENPEIVREALQKRHMEIEVVDEVIALDERRRAIILDVEGKKQNATSPVKKLAR